LRESFRIWSVKIADTVGSPAAVVVGIASVIAWALAGPYYHYSDTWQLVINSGSSIITFLMVFLIQSTQNRDAQAMQMKLNELIRAVSAARNSMVDLENCTDEEMQEIREEFASLRARMVAKRDQAGETAARQ
jgi:low affinity Fe/Cu permease